MRQLAAPERLDKPSTEPLRLNLGGRGTKIAGFKTVDLSAEHDVDFREDVSNLASFETNSVDEIYASHILEHFPHTKTVDVLKEWCRVLVPGKKLFISVPDFNEAIQVYLEDGMIDVVRNMLYGDQGYPLAFHYTGFTFSTLAKSCIDAGFSDIKRIKKHPHMANDCSTNVYTKTMRPISINAEVTK